MASSGSTSSTEIGSPLRKSRKSRINIGLGLLSTSDVYSADIIGPHAEAFDEDFDTESPLPFIGQYSFRKDGESHAWNPETIATLQLATRLGSYKKFKEYTSLVDNKPKPIFIRDFLDFRRGSVSKSSSNASA